MNKDNEKTAPDDFLLIERCLDGDKEAFAFLVERYQMMVYNIAGKMIGDEETARDMAQDSFISAYLSLKDFRNGSKFSTWLCSIVVNKCRDFLKSNRRMQVPIDEVEEPAMCLAPSPESELYRKQCRQHIRAALNTLSLEYREVIILKHMEGLDYREMEKILQVPVGVLKVRTYRAREKMKDILQKTGLLS